MSSAKIEAPELKSDDLYTNEYTGESWGEVTEYWEEDEEEVDLETDMSEVDIDPVVVELMKMFEDIDVDGSGTVCVEELSQIFRSYGLNASHDEILKMMNKIDPRSNGEINFENFLKLIHQSMPQLFDKKSLKQMKKNFLKNLKQVFDIFDRDGSGSISSDEFRFVLKKISHNTCTDEQIHQIIVLVDDNGDGVIDFDEFQSAVVSNRDLQKILEHLLRPSPLEVLQSLMLIPETFRPSVLFETLSFGTHLCSTFMTPIYDKSGLSFQDLILDTSKANSPELLPVYLETCGTFRMRFVGAKGVPSPNLNSPEFNSKKKITGYHATIAIFNKKEFLSNIYRVNCKKKATRDDIWMFNQSNTDNDIIIRTFHEGESTCLYIELVETIESREDSSKISHMCVGWTTVPLSNKLYNTVQDQKYITLNLQLQGGTYFEPMKIQNQDIRNRRKDILGQMQSILNNNSSKPSSTLTIHINRINSQRSLKFYSLNPPNLITSRGSVPVLELFRQFLAYEMHFHPTEHSQFAVIFEQLPKLMDFPMFWREFTKSWSMKYSKFKTHEKRDIQGFVKTEFLDHVMTFYPILHCISVSDLIQVPSSKIVTLAKTFSQTPKEALCQSEIYFKPFEISEIQYDLDSHRWQKSS